MRSYQALYLNLQENRYRRSPDGCGTRDAQTLTEWFFKVRGEAGINAFAFQKFAENLSAVSVKLNNPAFQQLISLRTKPGWIELPTAVFLVPIFRMPEHAFWNAASLHNCSES